MEVLQVSPFSVCKWFEFVIRSGDNLNAASHRIVSKSQNGETETKNSD